MKVRSGKHPIEYSGAKTGAFVSTPDDRPRGASRQAERRRLGVKVVISRRDKRLTNLSHFSCLACLQVRNQSHGASKLLQGPSIEVVPVSETGG